ncbi:MULTISPECIES: hypothetical protein [unclassified Streptomyces]|uniref:hypothetical protein n=1 Tax=unclassified Streptomyces TaxID=2593676 RepID=UPI000A6E9BDD|nr:hypothetical protein [Streptomyces sp. CB01883]
MADTNTPDADTQSDGSGDGQQAQPMTKKAKAFILAAVLVGVSGAIETTSNDASTWLINGIVSPFKGNGPHPKRSTAPPFTVQIKETSPWDSCDSGSPGGGMVYLKPPSASALEKEWKRRFTPPYDVLDERSDFDIKHSGQPATYTILKVTVQGATDTSVVINDVKVKPVAVTPAPHALRLAVSGACGDGADSSFSIDLDSPGQKKVFREGKNVTGAKLVRKFPFEVTKSTSETMEVVPFTNESDYRFKLVISWSSGSRHDDTVVGDVNHKNRPFRVVSGYQSVKYRVAQNTPAKQIQEPKVTDPFVEMQQDDQ